jgi:hypothetical protein
MITTTKKLFYWPKLKKEIVDYLTKCLECQKVKAENQHQTRLFQPLPITEWKWETISMDFITGLPISTKQNDTIIVVLEKLRKASHFIHVGIGADPGFNNSTMHQQNPNYWPFRQHLRSR